MRRYRTLLQTPLRLLMLLFWIAGLALMAGRLGQPLPDGSWATSAAVGALATLAIAGVYHVSALLLLALFLGLGAALTALRAVGADTPLIAGLATFLYAGLSWRFVTVAASHPLSRRITDFLHWDWGLQTGAGQRWIEQATHWSAFFITLITVALLLRPAPETYPHGTALAALGAGAVVLHNMGLFYRLRLHSFLVLAFAAHAAWLLWMPERLEAASLPGEVYALRMLFFGLSALAFWAGGCLLDFRAAVLRDSGPLADSLYRQPLRQAGILASLFGLTAAALLLDPGAPAGRIAADAVALSALGLLLSNHALRYWGLDLLALYGGAVVLWWLGVQAQEGQQRTDGRILSLLVLGTASASWAMGLFPRLAGRYPPLLNSVALTGFVLAAGIGLAQIPAHPPFGDAFVSWTFTILAFGLLFLRWPLPFVVQSHIRGVGFALLITVALAGFWNASTLDFLLRWGTLSWAFALWFLAEFVLPRVHLRWPHWAFAASSWPWIGLILVGANLLAGADDASEWTGLLLVAALYLFLMLRLGSLRLLAWFAVLFLTGAGLAGLIALLEKAPPELVGEYSLPLFAVGALLWANLLFSVARYCRKREEQSAPEGFWPTNRLALSFDCAFFGVAGWIFLLLSGMVALSSAPLILERPLPLNVDWFSLAPLCFLVGLSFVRSFVVKCHSALIHIFVAAFLCAWLAGFFALGAHRFLPPSLALSTAAGVMLLACLPLQPWPQIVLALDRWTPVVMLAAVAAGLAAFGATIERELVILAVNGGLAAILSCRLLNAVWLYGALVLLVLLLHDWPRLWLGEVPALLPWYALQLSLLGWLLSGWHPAIPKRYGSEATQEETPLLEFVGQLRDGWPYLMVLAVAESMLYGLSLADTWRYGLPPLGSGELPGSGAALLAGLSLLAQCVYRSSLIHLSTAALLCGWLAVFFASGAAHFLPWPLALSTGAGVLLLASLLAGAWPRSAQVLEKWTGSVLVLAIAAGFAAFGMTTERELAVLAVNAGLALLLACRLLSAAWLYGAFALLILLLHDWPRLWVINVETLLPWYALQLSLLAWLLSGWRLPFSPANETLPGAAENPRLEFAALLRNGWPYLVLLAAGELLVHGLYLAETLKYAPPPRGVAPLTSSAAALLAGLCLLAQGIFRLRGQPHSGWVYALILLALGMGVYGRLLVVGLQPVGLLDTAGFILGAFLLTIIHHVTTSVPALRVATWLPLLAPLTVPLQLASPDSTLTFLALGMLYFWMCRATERRLPLYLGLLFFNAAIYLWAPGWVDATRLVQIYAVPASLSVLILLHLHRKELKPSVLNTTRLAATGTLYASATLDIFLHNSALGVFVLALALSLAGVVMGIALRIRAFLFTGVSFMVLDVAGQLLNLYPEDRLGRAIVLMTLGSFVTGAMIWFNIKREAILRRIGIIRADLESWQ